MRIFLLFCAISFFVKDVFSQEGCFSLRYKISRGSSNHPEHLWKDCFHPCQLKIPGYTNTDKCEEAGDHCVVKYARNGMKRCVLKYVTGLNIPRINRPQDVNSTTAKSGRTNGSVMITTVTGLPGHAGSATSTTVASTAVAPTERTVVTTTSKITKKIKQKKTKRQRNLNKPKRRRRPRKGEQSKANKPTKNSTKYEPSTTTEPKTTTNASSFLVLSKLSSIFRSFGFRTNVQRTD